MQRIRLQMLPRSTRRERQPTASALYALAGCLSRVERNGGRDQTWIASGSVFSSSTDAASSPNRPTTPYM
ncbi:hypothetical protein SAMN04487926_105137 [Paraburkholderia steynii]|uniref:Uncharacterized protein n=1 Tax=Paraburkholderia steynii TaxID=1245441 RepID=A0A7Z7FG86_9BURK|nr:hypothetical protein SAMN04487926_105137 [Paraburkholderia steynii]